ncbi:MAG: hypothetical protein V1709_07045 [Planctomycetota bacterium]
MRKFAYELIGMGTAQGNYDGEFTPTVKHLILSHIKKEPGKVLHLFSGASTIGDVRIDIDNPNATHNMAVEDYLEQSNDIFKWVLLDPPYLVESHDLKGYKISKAFSADVPARQQFQEWAQEHTEFIIWLDLCAPMPAGFKRDKIYVLLHGGYRNVRVLSILKNRHEKQSGMKMI